MEDEIKKSKNKLARCCDNLEQAEKGSYDQQVLLDIIFDVKETIQEEVDRLENILSKTPNPDKSDKYLKSYFLQKKQKITFKVLKTDEVLSTN